MAETTPLPARIDGEPTRDYRRLCIWLQMGPRRSLLAAYNTERKAREAHTGASPKKSDSVPPYWRQLPAKWKWEERAKEWDGADAERLNRILADKREKQRERELLIAEKLYSKASGLLDMPHVRQKREQTDEETGKPVQYTIEPTDPAWFRTAAIMSKEGRESARAALEMTNVRAEIGGRDGQPIAFSVTGDDMAEAKDRAKQYEEARMAELARLTALPVLEGQRSE